MVAHVGDKVQVKASGGIRDAKSFLAMIQTGAQRIGTSSGIAIMEELKIK
ncbi:deoxyribose-phosphate aldolase [Enterococcus cecorum]|nr:deoxyribose-phosphate aldolase [Enterococcus cecorum]